MLVLQVLSTYVIKYVSFFYIRVFGFFVGIKGTYVYDTYCVGESYYYVCS